MTALQLVQKFHPEVQRVKDATRSLTIEVTSRDVNSASVKAHKDCAIAKACKGRPGVDGAIVAIRCVYLIKAETATRYRIPESITREIVAFDRSGGFTPGEYTLKKPTHKLGDMKGSGTKSKSRKQSGKPKFKRTAGIRNLFEAHPATA